MNVIIMLYYLLVSTFSVLVNAQIDDIPVVEDESGDADSQTYGLWVNLLIGSGITALCFIAFDPLRKRFPEIFETRRKLNEDRDPVDYYGNRIATPPAPSYKAFGWLLPTLRLDAEKLTDTHGLDAALFLRYHKFMFALFAVMSLPSLILVPVFFTGTNKDRPPTDARRTIGINRFSLGNLKNSEAWKFWLVLALEYVIMGFVCYFIFYQFTLYCRDRRRYRAARHPANYAILVQDVPHGARTSQAVTDYWDKVFPGEIATVFYVHDARNLEKWKEKFWQAVTKREVAEWRLHHSREVEKNRALKRKERAQSKKERREGKSQPFHFLRRRRTHLDKEESQGEYIEKQSSSSTVDNNKTFEEIEVGTIIDIDGATADLNQLPTEPKPIYNPSSADDAMADVDAMIDDQIELDRDSSIEDDLNEDATKSHFRGIFLRKRAPRNLESAVEYWEATQRKAWAKVSAYQSQRDQGHFTVTSSAIVVFKSRRSAAVASQTNFSKKENEWRVSRAPEPNAINWGALCVSGWTVYIRQAITMLLSSGLTLLWIFPVTFIMAIVSISSLVNLKIGENRPFEFFKPILDWPERVQNTVESILPAVILSLFLSWVPDIFAAFIGISRITSHPERDRLVRDWYFTFVTFSNFIFIAFAGTLISSFEKVLNDPKIAVSILAQNIPKQAAFLMNFILITTLSEAPRELLQLGRVMTRMFKLRFSAKTQRQREEAIVGDMEMDFVGVYATSQLVALLGLVYCTIQPFIIPCCMAYFAMIYLVYKYNLCYSYYNEYQDGGRMYGGAVYAIWVGLFSHLLTMVGVFSINRNPAQSALIIIPTILSVMFLMYCRKSFSRVLEHGSALESQDRVEQLEGCTVDVIEDELAATYEHPGWEELPKYTELENLNGVATEEDLAKAAEKEAMLDDLVTISDETEAGADEYSLDRMRESERSVSNVVPLDSCHSTTQDDDFHSVKSLSHAGDRLQSSTDNNDNNTDSNNT